MKTIINKILRFFEKNGLLKIFIAFILLIASVLLLKATSISILTAVFKVIGVTSIIYILLTIIIFLFAGIIDMLINKKKE
jgi:hypothetical protein